MLKIRHINHLLVTGGSGFIGSAFIRYVLTSVPEFTGLIVNLDALTYAGNSDHLKSVENDPRYFFQKGDIRNQALIEHLCTEHAIDTIIHFAAESHVDKSISGPRDFLETNIMGTFSLLEVVRKRPGIHFHHVSTDEVYGSLGKTGVFSETSPYRPNSPYAASKAASDHLVRAYATTYKISTCLSNCSNNYGPHQFPEKLIPLIITNCLHEKPLPIYGDGKQIRDWLYVKDHAAALWLLLNRGKKGETYNIGGASEWTNIDLVHEVAALLAQACQKDPQDYLKLITFVQDRAGHDFRYAVDCKKIHQEIGWSPAYSFAEGLEETVAWYLNHQMQPLLS